MRCGRCGAPLSAPVASCPACGLPVSPTSAVGESVEWITEPDRAFRLRRMAAVGVVSAVALTIAVILVVTSDRHAQLGPSPAAGHGGVPSSAPPTAQPKPARPPSPASPDVADSRLVADAGTLADILGVARQLRQTVASTIASAAACQQSPDAAAAALRDVLTARLSLEQQLRAMSIEPSLAPTANALGQALTTSDAADWDFVGWLDHAGVGSCPPAQQDDPSYQRGLADSQVATNAKLAFTDQWNPLAKRLDLSQIDPNTF